MHPYALDPARRCMPIEEWPEPDKLAWARLVKKASPLDDPGAGSTWRSPTEEGRRRYYGRWLTVLSEIDASALEERPADRITQARVSTYVDHLRSQGLSHRTIHGYLIALLILAQCLDRSRGWDWLLHLICKQHALASEDKGRFYRIAAAKVLFRGAIDYMEACASKPTHLQLDVHVRFRDGLMIALQAARCLRPKNLASIELGRHLITSSTGHRLVFTAEEIKTGMPYDAPFPPALEQYLQIYLTEHRPKLLQRRVSRGLWISNLGQKMSQASVSQRFKRMTIRLLGWPLPPHAFRHAAATSIAVEHPEILSATSAVLHHSNDRTAGRYYTMANGTAASRRYQDVLFSLSEEVE